MSRVDVNPSTELVIEIYPMPIPASARPNSFSIGSENARGLPGSRSRDQCACSEHMKATFTYWTEQDGKYLGYLSSRPDNWTQGEDFEDLKAHLRDLHEMFSVEEIPGIRKVAELEVA